MAKGGVMKGGVIKGGGRLPAAVVLSVFAGLWMLGMLVITAVAWPGISHDGFVMLIIGIFWAAGLFLSTLAARAVRQLLRFPGAVLALDVVPLPLGGWASGVVRAPVALHGAEVSLGVHCTRTRGTGENRSTTTLWRETKVLDGNQFARGPGYVEIPFAVRLPGPEAAGPSSGDLDWYVNASARLPGVDWDESFKVPVRVPAEGGVVAERPPREMPLLAGERLDAHLPGRVEIGADADVFHFPLKASFILWPLVLGAVALFLPLARQQGFLARLSDDAVFWIRVVSGVVALLSLVGLLLDPRRIEVRPDAVRIRRGLFGVGVHSTLARTEIAAVDETTSNTEPPLYQVKIRLRSGKTYDVAPNIYYHPEKAGALAARLRAILQVG